VLKQALACGQDRFLILEDDLNFVDNFEKKINHAVRTLKNTDWSVFYGGYDLKTPLDMAEHDPIIEITPSTNLTTSHFVAFQGKAIRDLIDYLELILTRKGGDPAGGPMHVDGAYSTFRATGYKTFIANPVLGYQRASRTDISPNAWFDQTPIIRNGIALARQLKNKLH
jgi:GR25 family glycosyltransferase involved in LPS biosynthesis